MKKCHFDPFISHPRPYCQLLNEIYIREMTKKYILFPSLKPQMGTHVTKYFDTLLPTWTEKTTIIDWSQSSIILHCLSACADWLKTSPDSNYVFCHVTMHKHQAGREAEVPGGLYLLATCVATTWVQTCINVTTLSKMLTTVQISSHGIKRIFWQMLHEFSWDLHLCCVIGFVLRIELSCRGNFCFFWISPKQRQGAHTCTGEQAIGIKKQKQVEV